MTFAGPAHGPQPAFKTPTIFAQAADAASHACSYLQDEPDTDKALSSENRVPYHIRNFGLSPRK
jgi:hypothetical protein